MLLQIFIFALFFSSCASNETKQLSQHENKLQDQYQDHHQDKQTKLLDKYHFDSDELKMVSSITGVVNTGLDQYDGDGASHLDLNQNQMVQKWVRYFSQKDRERFQRFLNRGEYYREVIESTLMEEGLPAELFYLPLIESGFSPRAYSRAHAVGPWQLIRATAKRYGLEVNYYIDERRDVIHSTEAATKYLKDLYNVFQSWELALAAYNCGELRVLRAVMKGKTRDFWELSAKKLLPRETRNYVPKFLAAATIGSNLDLYTFKLPKLTDRYPSVVAVDLKAGTKVTSLLKLTGIEKKEFYDLNPAIRRNILPPGKGEISIWVKDERVAKVLENKNNYQVASAKSRTRYTKIYRVRRGDNLYAIAKRHKTTVYKLKKINGLKNGRIYPGQKLFLRSRGYHRGSLQHYLVRKGDSLMRIARKFRIRLVDLKKLNGIKGSRIFVGQKLRIN